MAVDRERTPPPEAAPPGAGGVRRPTSGVADEDRTIPRTISRAPADDDDRTVPYPVPYPPPPPRSPTEGAPAGGEPAAAAAPGATRPKGEEMAPLPRGVSQQPPAPVPQSEDVTIVAPLAARGPRLVITEADGRTREVPLAKPETRIGRSTNCDIVLSSADVSRLHAAIVERPGGHALRPISARETTFLNGRAVAREMPLDDGDEILLGSQRLVYRQAAGEKVLVRGSRRRVLAATAGTAAALGIVALVVLFGGVGRHEGTGPTGKGADQAGSAPVVVQEPIVPVATGTQGPADSAPPAEQEAAATPVEGPPSPAAPAAEDREQKIRRFLYEGDVAFLEHRYLSPPEGSAVLAYLEVLQLDSTNERARGQLGRIVDDYLAWAERAMRQRNRTQALLNADKAAYIQRQAPDVLADPSIERRLGALRR